MFHTPKSLAADCNSDANGLIAMRAALRAFKVSIRKSAEHPRRAEILDILTDARARIDRINGPA
jgi:hypothetical protein